MEELSKKPDSNIKTQLSLAAALFFSPFVNAMLKKGNRDIPQTDKDFIHGYVKFGYITLFLLVIAILAGIGNYLLPLQIFNMTYTISIFILIFMLFISIVSILSDIRILKGGGELLETQPIEGNKKDVILKYLPLYNIVLRYQAHSFDRPNRWIKESIILRTGFILVCMTGNALITSIALIAIILRIAGLMSDIDFIHNHSKQVLNQLFTKNPEEIRGYVTGFLTFVIASVGLLFMRNANRKSLIQHINSQKEVYMTLYAVKENKRIWIEYLLGVIILGGVLYIAQVDFTIRTYDLGLALLVGRYAVLYAQWKHLPHLPLAREIMLVGNIFKKKV